MLSRRSLPIFNRVKYAFSGSYVVKIDKITTTPVNSGKFLDFAALSFSEAQHLVENHRQYRGEGQGGLEERSDVVGYSHIQAGQEIAA